MLFLKLQHACHLHATIGNHLLGISCFKGEVYKNTLYAVLSEKKGVGRGVPPFQKRLRKDVFFFQRLKTPRTGEKTALKYAFWFLEGCRPPKNIKS